MSFLKVGYIWHISCRKYNCRYNVPTFQLEELGSKCSAWVGGPGLHMSLFHWCYYSRTKSVATDLSNRNLLLAIVLPHISSS